MLRIFLGRVYWLMGVGLFIGISGYRTPDACAQDANAASVAELQQRVQELETVVRQMKDHNQVPTADPAASAATPVDANGNQFVPAVPNAAVGRSRWQSGGRQSGINHGQEFLGLEQRLLPAVARSSRASCGSRANSRPIIADSSIPSTRPRPPIRRGRQPDHGQSGYVPHPPRTSWHRGYHGELLRVSLAARFRRNYRIQVDHRRLHERPLLGSFQFEIGKFKQPFSYEDLIQDRYVPTMERSMMDQLCPQRDEGAMIHGEKLFCGRFDYAFAVSNGDPNDSSIDDNNNKDLNARVVFRPFYGDDVWNSSADCESEFPAVLASRTTRSAARRRPRPPSPRRLP